MRSNWESYIDDCGELNFSKLAENAAGHWNQNDVGGPLDDETHWIWDCATAIDEDIVAQAREIMQDGDSEVSYEEVMYGNNDS